MYFLIIGLEGVHCHKMNNFEMGEARKNDWDSVAEALIRDIENFKVFKISAERNIYPENDDCNIVKSTGEGVTAKISSYLNNSTMDERIIEETLLNDLNHILLKLSTNAYILYPNTLLKSIS